MATPLGPDQLAAALRAEGCVVVEIAGWQTRNRNSRGAWGPMNGVVIHHTGSDTGAPRSYAGGLLAAGYAGLPGPLCHAGGGPDGKIYLVGLGRANHAGGGDPAVLNAVINDAVPMDRELRPARGNRNGVDGNSHFYGLEVMYSGGHPMTGPQYDQAVRWASAICRAHGWTAQSVIAHREWSSDKHDPGQHSMVQFRADVAKRLATKPGSQPAPAPAADPNTDPTTASKRTDSGMDLYWIESLVDGGQYLGGPYGLTHLHTPDETRACLAVIDGDHQSNSAERDVFNTVVRRGWAEVMASAKAAGA